MRGAALAVAFAALAAACSLLPSDDGRRLVAEVTNTGSIAAEFAMGTPAGIPLPFAVEPASLAAGATGKITFFLPPGEDYVVIVNGQPSFEGWDMNRWASKACPVHMNLDPAQKGGVVGGNC